MKQVFDLEQLSGKTIRACRLDDSDESMIFVFDDETFFFLRSIGEGWLNCGYTFIRDSNDFDLDELHEIGMLSDSEHQKIIDAQEKAYKEKRQKEEANERATYEKLKAKFEPGT